MLDFVECKQKEWASEDFFTIEWYGHFTLYTLLPLWESVNTGCISLIKLIFEKLMFFTQRILTERKLMRLQLNPITPIRKIPSRYLSKHSKHHLERIERSNFALVFFQLGICWSLSRKLRYPSTHPPYISLYEAPSPCTLYFRSFSAAILHKGQSSFHPVYLSALAFLF